MKNIKRLPSIFKENIAKIVFLILLYITLNFLSTLPYLNIFFTDSTNIFLLWLTIIILFHLRTAITAGIAVGCLIISTLLLQVGYYNNALAVSDAMYTLFFISIIQECIYLIRKR